MLWMFCWLQHLQFKRKHQLLRGIKTTVSCTGSVCGSQQSQCWTIDSQAKLCSLIPCLSHHAQVRTMPKVDSCSLFLGSLGSLWISFLSFSFDCLASYHRKEILALESWFLASSSKVRKWGFVRKSPFPAWNKNIKDNWKHFVVTESKEWLERKHVHVAYMENR